MRGGPQWSRSNPVVKRVHGADKGRFELRSTKLLKPGAYRMVAKHLGTGSRAARSPGRRGSSISTRTSARRAATSSVKALQPPAPKQGYYTTHGRGLQHEDGLRGDGLPQGERHEAHLQRLAGDLPQARRRARGGFHLKYPGAGKHVEVDISRQVMVLANHGKPQYTFHVSTGAAGDPDDPRPLHSSTGARPGLQLGGHVLLGLLAQRATRSTATTRCRPIRPATVASATRSPSRTSSTTG